jgi:hypothetical protein
MTNYAYSSSPDLISCWPLLEMALILKVTKLENACENWIKEHLKNVEFSERELSVLLSAAVDSNTKLELIYLIIDMISNFHECIKYLDFDASFQFKRYLTVTKLIKDIKSATISQDKIEDLLKLMTNNSFSNEESEFLKTQRYNEEKIRMKKASLATINIDERASIIYKSPETKYDQEVSQDDKFNTIKYVLKI